MMMNARWAWIGAALLIAATGCSSDDDGAGGGTAGADAGGSGGSSGGSGGSGGTGGGSGGTGGSSAGSGGSAAGGSAGAGSCEDAQNPMFGSCIESFLAGCWAPDLSGTCSSENGATTWSDGSKYDPQGSNPGMYGPGDAEPCIGIETDGGNITATKGSQTLVYVADQTTETATITCPDGSTFEATFEQVTAFNTCVGLNCSE